MRKSTSNSSAESRLVKSASFHAMSKYLNERVIAGKLTIKELCDPVGFEDPSEFTGSALWDEIVDRMLKAQGAR